MGDILLHGHIGEFRNNNLESQEPVVSPPLGYQTYD